MQTRLLSLSMEQILSREYTLDNEGRKWLRHNILDFKRRTIDNNTTIRHRVETERNITVANRHFRHRINITKRTVPTL